MEVSQEVNAANSYSIITQTKKNICTIENRSVMMPVLTKF